MFQYQPVKKKNIRDILLTIATMTFVSAIGSTSIVAALKSDTNSCAISPDNSGCELNRPFDVKEKKLDSFLEF